MSKIYTLLFVIMLTIFSGCEANHAANAIDVNATPVSDANITINENDLLKTNDTTPAFSGKYFNINSVIGISLSIGGATYKIYPDKSDVWSLDTEVPNTVKSGVVNGATITKLTSGTLNLLTDGTYDIKIEAEDANGTIYKLIKQLIIDTTTDAEVTIEDIERRVNTKPKFTGQSKNVHEQIKLSIDGASFSIIPDTNGNWELDTNIQNPEKGDLNLVAGQVYEILVDASDLDGNNIEQIKLNFNAGLLSISSAIYINKNTNETDDDILYIYFNKYIDTSSTQGSPHLYINVNGTGSIGTGSNGFAWHNIFDTYRINFDNTSEQLDINSTKVSLIANQIADSSGNVASENNELIQIEKFDTLARLHTGDIMCVSDSNTSLSVECNATDVLKTNSSYINESLSRNITDTNGVIYYTNVGLSWQKEDDNIAKTYSVAKEYCDNLDFAGINTWKIPNMKELSSIVHHGRNYPKINNVFSNTKNKIYWSRDSYLETSNYWGIDFSDGMNASEDTTNTHYVRCVSVRE